MKLSQVTGNEIDRILTWEEQINKVAIELNKPSAMLSEMRPYTD